MGKNTWAFSSKIEKKNDSFDFFFGTRWEVVSEAANRQSASFDWMLTVARTGTQLQLQRALEEQK